jgi:hypothetical protein
LTLKWLSLLLKKHFTLGRRIMFCERWNTDEAT